MQDSAPRELISKVTELLGAPYVKGSAAEPQVDPRVGFDCWGWAWYYLKLSGIVIPLNAWEAEKEFELVEGPPRWRDIVMYKEKLNPIPHCGAMESEYIVVHCSATTGGVARGDVSRDPWRDDMKIMRHNSLL